MVRQSNQPLQDDQMKKYPSLNYPGDKGTEGLFSDGQIFIQEKLDGANFRFHVTGDGELEFGSRNVVGDLDSGQFGESMQFIRDRVDPEYVRELEDSHPERYVFYGEAMIPHTLSYDWEQTPAFIGFDVWCKNGGYWMHPEEAQDTFYDIGLPDAPIIDMVFAEGWDDYNFEVPQSEYGDVEAEGVVFKNPEMGVRAKHVRDDFKEKNKQTFGASKKKDLTDTELFVEEYFPPARVRKNAHKLVDEGDYADLEMEMMRDLPEKVIRDAIDEEGGEIFMSENYTIDIGEVRSLASSRCAAVLRQMIDARVTEKLRGAA